MTKKAEHWVKQLDLLPHPEGGYYKQMLKSEESFTLGDGRVRPAYTSIYFLLTAENPSHFHRLKSDEVWYFHEGVSLTVHMLHSDGTYEKTLLGKNPEQGEHLQTVVPNGTVFGSTVEEKGGYALVSCMVSPGFDFADFELFTQADLLKEYPGHKEIIERLAYEELPE